MTLEYRYKLSNSKNDEKSPLLLLLHGLGADENDLFGLVPYLDDRFFIASARAPYNLPYGGFGWFELIIGPDDIGVNIKQFEQSRLKILQFIDEIVEEHDLDKNRVFLCGFSQGAMMSMSALFSEPQKFAGVVAMSGRAMPEMLPENKDPDALKDFPIFVTHGINDPLLPIENGRATKELLENLPVDLKYREYPMAHEISPESLSDVREWLTQKLTESGKGS
ncbi:MAG: prolyl oligopeptidase family serine peptidase [Pyrinomonadaceae bacterium]|nr:prolyl oligopeptidase family serine peptidase [Pyrinomonadaceae bacterium]